MAFRQKLYHFVIPTTLLLTLASSAQTTAFHRQGRTQQYSSGVTWAMQAMVALTGGIQVSSVTESGSVVRTIGNDQESGTISMQSTGNTASQITVSTNLGNRSETRQWDSGGPSGQWIDLDGQPHPMAQPNCWTDAVWFFPALSMLSDYADPTLVFTDHPNLGHLQGGNYNFFENAYGPSDLTTCGADGRCANGVHFPGGYFVHLDTSNPVSGVGALFQHFGVDVVLGNFYYNVIPRPWP